MNTVATRAAGGALASITNLKAGLQNVQTSVHVKGGEPILRMGRDGIWVFGADNVEVEEGSKWAVNPLSLQHGFVCWKVIPENSKEKPELFGEELVSMFQTPPAKHELPDYGHPWVDIIAVQLKCVSGEDVGEQVIYKPSSTGGLRAMKEQLIAAIMGRPDDDPNVVPIVVLKNDHYQHKTWGKTYVPIFEIVEWVSMDGVAADEPEEPAEQAPKATPRRAAAPERETQTVTEEDTAEVSAEALTGAAEGGERRRRRRG